MIEIGFHGKDKCVEILASAAFKEGKFCQAFVSDGWSFCRIDDKPVRRRSLECCPDIAILNDERLLTEVECDGIVIVNSPNPPEELKLFGDVVSVDATRHVLDILSPSLNGNVPDTFHVRQYDDMELVLELVAKPVINTVMLGAIAALKIVSMQSIADVMRVKNPKLVNAAWEIYKELESESRNWQQNCRLCKAYV